MSKPITRFPVGKPVKQWPSVSWDTIGDAIEGLESNPQLPPEPLPSSTGGFESVANKTGSPLDAPFSILRLEEPINQPADDADAPYQPLIWDGQNPNQETVDGQKQWAILQSPVSDGGESAAVVLGLSWVRIDVQNTADTTAGPIAGDATKLTSGSGVPIVWKEAGTGEKWAVVLLGGGTKPTEFIGLASTDVTASQPTFTVTVDELRQGPDPRGDPAGDPGELITVKHPLNKAVTSGDKVPVEANDDGSYTAFPGGDATAPGKQFELTADLALGATETTARLLNADGTVQTPEMIVTVTDKHQRYSGLGPYIDTEDINQPGFRGSAVSYDDGGTIKWRITDIERLYPTILVSVAGGTDTDVGPFESDFKKGYGNSYRNPQRLASGVMNTYNTDHLADNAPDPSLWVAQYQPETDQYELITGGNDLATGTADSLILTEAAGVPSSVTLSGGGSVSGFINKTERTIWLGSQVLVSLKNKWIISSNAASMITATATQDSPSTTNHFTGGTAANFEHFSPPTETFSVVDPLGVLGDVKSGDGVVFSIVNSSFIVLGAKTAPPVATSFISGCGITRTVESVNPPIFSFSFDADTVAGAGLQVFGGCGLQVELGDCLVFQGNAININTIELAGNGLRVSSGNPCEIELAVGAGCGLGFGEVDGVLELRLADIVGGSNYLEQTGPCTLDAKVVDVEVMTGIAAVEFSATGTTMKVKITPTVKTIKVLEGGTAGAGASKEGTLSGDLC